METAKGTTEAASSRPEEKTEIPMLDPSTATAPASSDSNNILSNEKSSVLRSESTTILQTLKRNGYPIILTTIYAIIAITAWILTAIITAKNVLFNLEHEGEQYVDDFHNQFVQIARILRTITNAVTIPVSAAICSMAAVAYMQTSKHRQQLSLRQIMALADTAWLSPRMWICIFNKEITTGLLKIAVLLTLVGFIGQIAQEGFITEKPAVARDAAKFYSIHDIPHRFGMEKGYFGADDNAQLVAQLKSLLESARSSSYNPHVWSSSGSTLAAAVTDPDEYFVSELPSSFNSGIWSGQFAPRLNSSVVYETISTEEFRDNCHENVTVFYENEPNGFYVHYEKNSMSDKIAYTACIPGVLTKSPWKPTRDRQDITEVLYLNFTTQRDDFHDWNDEIISGWHNISYRKIVAQSTMGYFETPSYQSYGLPGPLVEKGPPVETGWVQPDKEPEDPPVLHLEKYALKGPLLSLTFALFGQTSWISELFSDRSPSTHRFRQSQIMSPRDWRECVEHIPMSGLNQSEPLCTTFLTSVSSQIQDWMTEYTTRDPTKMLSQAVALSNIAWMTQYRPYAAYSISANHGISAVKQHISPAGFYICTALLALHLLGLFILAIYTCHATPWTSDLDSFAMLRIGAQFADRLGAQSMDKLPMGLRKSENVKALDELPGFIGDASPEEDVGALAMGAQSPLAKNRAYFRF